jgi:hypothetical protein
MTTMYETTNPVLEVAGFGLTHCHGLLRFLGYTERSQRDEQWKWHDSWELVCHQLFGEGLAVTDRTPESAEVEVHDGQEVGYGRYLKGTYMGDS